MKITDNPSASQPLHGTGAEVKRKKAEEMAREEASRLMENREHLSSEEIHQILHELRVHQIELEMQNEELRTAQEQLDAVRARYFDLYDLAPVGYCTIGEDGLILEANLTMAVLLGNTRYSLIKQPISRFIHKEDQDKYYLCRKQLFEADSKRLRGTSQTFDGIQPQAYELRMMKQDGSSFWVHLTMSIVQDDDGALTCRIAISDITEHRRLAEALRESDAQFRVIFEVASVGILQSDRMTGKILRCNETYGRITGYPVSELIGISFIDLTHPEDRQRDWEIFSRAAQGETPFYHNEKRYIRKDGSVIWVRVNAAFVRDLTGQAIRTVAICEDITEHKKMSDALKQSHEMLEHKVAERTAELVVAMEEAEKRKRIAETAVTEIKKLKEQLEAERSYLIEEIKLENNHEKIIGQSDGLTYVLFKVDQIADSDTPVLILGETGTGKELVARAIHSLSQRKVRPLVKVNCAALPSNLIESELFGHERGAFTGAHTRRAGRFEVAHRATLFLDEIGELPLELQSKLLQVLQEGKFERLGSSHTIKVDVRILAATNRNLEEEVRKGRFREDLWYRLNVFPITIPPLRDRLEDIPLLTHFYVEKIAKRMGKIIEVIPAGTMNILLDYHWPGNVRELENVLERAVINSSGTKLRLVDALQKPATDLTVSKKTLAAVERDHIIQTLEQTGWKVGGKGGAAEILGLDRSTLRARMRKLNIQKP